MSFRGTSKLNLARWSRMRSHCFCISLSTNSRLLNLKSFRDLQHMYQTFTFCNYFKDVALFCDFHHFFVDVSKNVTFNICSLWKNKNGKIMVGFNLLKTLLEKAFSINNYATIFLLFLLHSCWCQ